MITADYHVHSCYSSDSQTPMVDMIEQAIQLGFKKICFTDHMDYDFPDKYNIPFVFNPKDYFDELSILVDKYKNKIKVLQGIELGLQPYLADRYQKLLNEYDFDFVIASSHLVDQIDPYHPEYWTDKTPKEGIERYFQSIIENVNAFSGFQVYGHIDYVVRYAPDKNLSYTYMEYADILDEVIRTILNAGKGIEVNTSGYKYGLGFTHPHKDVLRRYKELGGELITIGSDGHKPEHLAYDFHRAEEMLLSLGFKYYATFEKQKPVYEKLG